MRDSEKEARPLPQPVLTGDAPADADATDRSNHPVIRSGCHPSFKRRGVKGLPEGATQNGSLPMPLEVLDFFFMLLGGFFCFKSAEVSALAGLFVFFY